jgi:hypothetical protein
MKLKDGHIIVFHPDSVCISVCRHGKTEKWLDGSDKKLASFIRSDEDLFVFASLLASSQGLICNKVSGNRFWLVKPKK